MERNDALRVFTKNSGFVVVDRKLQEVKWLHNGFTIDWDVESVGSPYFDPHPAFGLAVDCVKLRVYPNETDTRGHN